MANNLGINFTEDLKQAISDLPNVLTIGNYKYNCVADEERESIQIEDGGTYSVYDRMVYLVLSEIHTIPSIRQTVILDSIRYSVTDKNRQQQSDTLTLTLRREDGQ